MDTFTTLVSSWTSTGMAGLRQLCKKPGEEHSKQKKRLCKGPEAEEMAEKYSHLKFVCVRWQLGRKAGRQRRFLDAAYGWLAGCLEQGHLMREGGSEKGKTDCTRDREDGKWCWEGSSSWRRRVDGKSLEQHTPTIKLVNSFLSTVYYLEIFKSSDHFECNAKWSDLMLKYMCHFRSVHIKDFITTLIEYNMY